MSQVRIGVIGAGLIGRKHIEVLRSGHADYTLAGVADPESDLPVLELGPGTGVVTRALLARGVAPERIVAIEYSSDFVVHLRRDMPEISVLQGCAFNLDKTPVVGGTLMGIKGQYLIFDGGVINMRKYGGYQVAVSLQ